MPPFAPNTNAATLNGATFASPGNIGTGTPGTLACTSMTSTLGGTFTAPNPSAACINLRGRSGDGLGAIVFLNNAGSTDSAIITVSSAGAMNFLTGSSDTQTMAVSLASAKTNLTIVPPTSSAGLAAGTLYQGAANAAFFA